MESLTTHTKKNNVKKISGIKDKVIKYFSRQRCVCNLPHWENGIWIFSCVSWSSLLSCVILNDCVYKPKEIKISIRG